jgi:hypothetical protein
MLSRRELTHRTDKSHSSTIRDIELLEEFYDREKQTIRTLAASRGNTDIDESHDDGKSSQSPEKQSTVKTNEKNESSHENDIREDEEQE